jgi:hypothetical protein
MKRDRGLVSGVVQALWPRPGRKAFVSFAFFASLLAGGVPVGGLAGPIVARSGAALDVPGDERAPDLLQFRSRSGHQPTLDTSALEFPTLDDALLPFGPGIHSAAPDGESLAQVLRSITNRRLGSGAATAHKGLSDRAAEEPDAVDRMLEQAYLALLDSESLGAILRSVVHVEVEGGRRSFDVLGIGRFEVGISQEGDNLYLTESSTGLSIPLQPTSTTPDEGAQQKPQGTPISLIGLASRILMILDNSEWLFLSIVVGLILIPFLALRMAIRANRRATPPPMRLVR